MPQDASMIVQRLRTSECKTYGADRADQVVDLLRTQN